MAPFADPLFRFVRGTRAGFINANGKVILSARLDEGSTRFAEFHEGLLATSKNDGAHYVDRTGKLVFRVKGVSGGDFHEGLAHVSQVQSAPNYGWKVGFVDRTGRTAIDLKFTDAGDFSDGIARVTTAGETNSTGYINKQGNFIIAPELVYGHDFHEGKAAVILKGPCRITNGGSCARLTFAPRDTCRFAFIDKTGKPISALLFEDAGDFSEGLAPVYNGSKWGYVNAKGEIAIRPAFDYAEPFSDGLALVWDTKLGNGFIDHSGKLVIPFQQRFARSFSNGRALVSSSVRATGPSTFSFIDKSGNLAFPAAFLNAGPFANGLAPVFLGGNRYGWINTSGRSVFEYSVPR